MQNSFNEDDQKNFIDFLNAVAIHAEFKGMDTKKLCEYFKLLAHMQQVMLPKINSNILEVVKVGEIEPKKAPVKKAAKKSK